MNPKTREAIFALGYPKEVEAEVSDGHKMRLPITSILYQDALFWLLAVHKVSLRINHSETFVDKPWFFDFKDIDNGYYDDSLDCCSFLDEYGWFAEYKDAMDAGIIAICEYLKKKSSVAENSLSI